MNEILLITGSYPPDICGVGDYSYNLVNARPNNWKVYSPKDWNYLSIVKKIKFISKHTAKTIIIQYPTEGYGWSLVPQLLCVYFSWFSKKKCIVAIHEFANRSLKAKIATSIFWLSNKIIFTSDFERDSAIAIFPLLKSKSKVIKIISNIPAPQELKQWNERTIDIAYFGHLRPNKGLEDFFKVCKILRNRQAVRICIIGQVLETYRDYFEKLQNDNADLPIQYQLNQSAQIVAEMLNQTKICFLPFPDGLSERRGSFLAAILGGAKVVSYDGKFITEGLREISIITNSAEASNALFDSLCSTSDADHRNLLNLYKDYIFNNIPNSWENIAKCYEEFSKR